MRKANEVRVGDLVKLTHHEDGCKDGRISGYVHRMQIVRDEYNEDVRFTIG